LLADFEIEKAEYYRRTGSSTWEETSERCAAGIVSPVETNCVALLAAVVRKDSGEHPSRASVET
jgi:hypothetical protein